MCLFALLFSSLSPQDGAAEQIVYLFGSYFLPYGAKLSEERYYKKSFCVVLSIQRTRFIHIY